LKGCIDGSGTPQTIAFQNNHIFETTRSDCLNPKISCFGMVMPVGIGSTSHSKKKKTRSVGSFGRIIAETTRAVIIGG
jgi:hypothetical protein